MRKLLLLTSFLVITPLFLLFNIIFLLNLAKHKNSAPEQTVIYAALPTAQNEFLTKVIQEDIRVNILEQFFSRYNSPLVPFAENVVASADLNKLDYRLIPAIAMQESNLCNKILENSYNCWGFGIYGKKVKKFDNYPQAIETVTKALANYKTNNGLRSPEEIMTKYAPSNDGSWAKSVSYFMTQMDQLQ